MICRRHNARNAQCLLRVAQRGRRAASSLRVVGDAPGVPGPLAASGVGDQMSPSVPSMPLLVMAPNALTPGWNATDVVKTWKFSRPGTFGIDSE